MADLPTGFWSGWVIVLTALSLFVLAWLTLSIYFGDNKAETDGEDPVWDGNLQEVHAAPPLWWFWLLFGAMIISLVYLMLFPGLGSYGGMLNWSQGSRLAESTESFEQEFAVARERIADMSVVELQNDLELMATAERIFTRECAACHGLDGRGQASMFPNLQDIDWQWGSSPEQIEQSIRQGRQALMPPWEAALSPEGVDQVTDYVLQINESGAANHPGKANYDAFCVACHGDSGGGNLLLGAPDITDDIWLYGNSRDQIRDTIANGRTGIMPAFQNRLDDVQVALLVALLAR